MNSNIEPVTCENVMSLSLDEVRTRLFGMVEAHNEYVTLDPVLYVRLLGDYAGMYQYVSEIYVYLIARTRAYSEAKNTMKKIQAMDRRDCIEQIQKVLKLNYESLSRKITVMSEEDK